MIKESREHSKPNQPLPPGPHGLPILGSLIPFRRERPEFLLRLFREHGDIAHFKLLGVDAVLLSHPDHIRDLLVTNHRLVVKSRALERAKLMLGEGLLTSEGDFHLRQRRLAQPAFHRKRVASYAQVMADFAARTLARWDTLGDGAVVEMDAEMMRLTLGIVGKTLFDADVEKDAPEVGQAMHTVLNGFFTLLLPFSERWENWPLPPLRRLRAARDQLDAILFRIIQERRASGEDKGDLLSMLLLAQDEEGDGGGMSDTQVRDEAMTLFLAGHETTAVALTWTWYLLSQHPEVMRTLQAELDEVLGGRLPTFDDVSRLRYTRMVFAESMRLYPPAWVVGRRALTEYEVGGYTLPAGSMFFASQYVVHRHPDFWPEPERFDPQRWTPEAEAARPKFAYFPFGGGPRLCIGEQFAWMEGILVLATLAQRWHADLLPGHPVALEPLITLRPKHGMKMILRQRHP